MQIVPLAREHLPFFFQQAKAENWITSGKEIAFLAGCYPSGCLTAFTGIETAGFITSIRYERSGWIGNLLVLPGYRRRGFGRALMEKVISTLEADGCETLWLTASPDGAPLYRALGFKEIDTISRWQGLAQLPVSQTNIEDSAGLVKQDELGWGDRRTAIFEKLNLEQCYAANDRGFILAATTENGMQIGPWSATGSLTAVKLFNKVTSFDGGHPCVLDSPDSNHAAAGILTRAGFSRSGETLLMYRGRKPDYHPEQIYALASMGSYG